MNSHWNRIAVVLIVILNSVISGVAGAQTPSLPPQYVQQDQHNSHLLFGLSAQVLGTYCHLNWAPGDARCYLEFEDEEGARTNIFFHYEELARNEQRLLARLKDLSARWKRKYPLDFWGRTVFFMYRKADHEALDELIQGIESEGLAHRVLIRSRDEETRKIPYFYSEDLVRGVFHIFIEIFSRYDLREGMWGPGEKGEYRDPLAGG